MMDEVTSMEKLLEFLKEGRYMFLAVPVEDGSAKYRFLHCLEAFLCLDRIGNDWELRNMMKHGGWENVLVTKDLVTGKERPMRRDEVVEWMRKRIWDVIDEEIDLDKALE